MSGSPREQFEYYLIITLCYWLASLLTGLWCRNKLLTTFC